MLKSRFVKVALVAVCLTLGIVGAANAMIFVDIEPIPNDTNGGLAASGDGYIWSYCAAEYDDGSEPLAFDLVGVEMELTLNTEVDPTDPNNFSFSLFVPCADTTTSCTTSGGETGTVWTCELNSGWTEGSMSWTATAMGSDESTSDSTGPYTTGTGPTALTLSRFGGVSGLALALALPLAVLGGVVYTKHKR